MFLGTERKEVKHFEVSFYDYLSLGIFALLCAGIGFYPQPFVRVVNDVLSSAFIPGGSSPALLGINWFYISLIFLAILAGTILIYMVKWCVNKKYGKKISPAWGCGYDRLNSRMQYTASSFADELNSISKTVLGYRKRLKPLAEIFPAKNKLESHADDFVDSKILMPWFKKFSALISRFELLSYSDIRYYVAFILIIISIYSLIGFLWI